LLAVWSAASGVGGLVYGARAARRELDATYMHIALLFPFACLPLILASSPLAIAGLVILAGLPIAPLIASRNELLAAIAPRGSGAEAFTWLTTALVSGLSAGAAAAGILVEAQGWRAAVIAGVVVAAIGGAVAAICRDRLVPVAAT
jgi:predicted MFS family arabinose efflux permease